MVPKALLPLMLSMVIGLALIALGLIPGLTRALSDALERFPGPPFSNPPRRSAEAYRQKPTAEPWVAIMGLALIAVELAGYLWNR